MNWFLLPISHLTLMSFCTQGLPGVAESTISIRERKPSPLGEGARVRADEGWCKVLFTGPLPPSATAPLLRRARVIFWMMDSATSPSASRRMTGGGGRHAVKSENSLTRETDQKGAWHYVD